MVNVLGRPVKYPPIMFGVGRYLTAEDIARFRALPRGGGSTGPPLLQRLTVNHRRAARLIAQGKSAVEVAALVGRTPQRIRDLASDPTFANAVALYAKSQADVDDTGSGDAEEGALARGTLLEIAELSLESIRDDLERDPKSISLSERRQLATMALDRTVAPPRTPTAPAAQATNITFNIAGPKGLRGEVFSPGAGDPVASTSGAVSAPTITLLPEKAQE
jgi:hypothetical protein